MNLTQTQLTKPQVNHIFETYMKHDFPPSELKPWNKMEELIDKGAYISYGFYEGEELVAYTLFAKGDKGNYLLLDYFAVCEAKRSGGYGSQIIAMLKECLSSYDAILGEIEDPDKPVDAQDQEIRSRRYNFYMRGGLRATDVRITLFGVEMLLIAMEFKPAGDEVLMEALEDIYNTMFTQKTRAQHIRMSRL